MQLPVTFGLDSEHCELLAAFESVGSLTELAALRGRDLSVISRQMQKVAEIAPVLEKRHGRWILSELGRQLAQWTRDAAMRQRQILREETVLRIASTREFTARVLAPRLRTLLRSDERVALSILTAEDGVERLLLDGRADLGFDCGSPADPVLRFKASADEAFAVVAAASLLRRRRIATTSDLLALPHLRYQRAAAPRLLQLSHEVPNIVATFNDIAAIREACVSGLGWAVLPLYAVRRELQSRALTQLPLWKIRNERFGVWWMSGRTDLEPWIERASRWLESQTLA